MVRMEIACFLILVFVAFIYFSAGRKNTALHKTFSALLIAMLFHLVFDAITIYTVNHLETVPTLLNDILHRFFIGTMVLVVYFFYRHISFVVEDETGTQVRFMRFANIFLVIAELGALVLPIHYAVTPLGNYSDGIHAAVIYVSMSVYLLLCVGMLVFHWRRINRKKKFVIAAALIIELCVSFVQAIVPTSLISGMGLTLMTMAFYLTLENPDILMGELVEQKLSMLYLKSQVNPHFLYNTLDTIRIQAELNQDKEVANQLMHLVNFFRLSVKVDRQMVALDDEMELLYAYMELMCYRYPKLKVSYEIDPELGEVLVPNFILQPLVENSLLHGLKNKGYQGELKVIARKYEGQLPAIEVQVIDTGSGFDKETREKIEELLLHYNEKEQKLEGDSIGVLNVQKRIKLLCGKKYGLWYTDNEDCGVTAHMLLRMTKGSGR